MACFHPLKAWRTRGGDVQFKPGGAVGLSFSVPCGQCIGCRLERSRQWAVRCMYEAKLHDDNCFITLTYDDANLPSDNGLNKKHFQDFMKRLRKRFNKKIRYFYCGEYGEKLKRPHYHALLFGVDFNDKILHGKRGNNCIWTSCLLAELWPFGFSSIGQLTFESAAYVARYCLKKRTGLGSERHYQRVVVETGEIIQVIPEFINMSLKPGIGAGWFERFSGDVYPSDFLIIRGAKCRPPRYFDKLFERGNSVQMERIRLKRVRFASRFRSDNTPERLQVREQVKVAEVSRLKRELE